MILLWERSVGKIYLNLFRFFPCIGMFKYNNILKYHVPWCIQQALHGHHGHCKIKGAFSEMVSSDKFRVA